MGSIKAEKNLPVPQRSALVVKTVSFGPTKMDNVGDHLDPFRNKVFSRIYEFFNFCAVKKPKAFLQVYI